MGVDEKVKLSCLRGGRKSEEGAREKREKGERLGGGKLGVSVRPGRLRVHLLLKGASAS